MEQKTCGLFDSGVTGVTNGKVASADDITTTAKASTSSDDTSMITEENFGEVFTDLTDFLLQQSAAPSESVEESVPSSSSIRRAEKRAMVSSSTVDHDAYTLKAAKRARVEEEEDSDDSDEVTTTTKTKTERYYERRVKNNIASRRSRETRKQKFLNMEDEAERLEAHNRELEAKVLELEALANTMKAMLVKRLAKS